MKGNPLFEVVIQPARLLCFSKSSLKLRKYKIYINTFGVSIISPINKVFKMKFNLKFKINKKLIMLLILLML